MYNNTWAKIKNLRGSSSNDNYEINYFTIKRYNRDFVKADGKTELSLEDYWEVERALRA